MTVCASTNGIHYAAHKQQYNYVSLNPQSTIRNFLRTYIHTYIHTNKHPRIAPHLLHDYLPIANAFGNNAVMFRWLRCVIEERKILMVSRSSICSQATEKLKKTKIDICLSVCLSSWSLLLSVCFHMYICAARHALVYILSSICVSSKCRAGIGM